MMAARAPSAASARTADVMRTDVRSELESGRCQHGDPNDGSGSATEVRHQGKSNTIQTALNFRVRGRANPMSAGHFATSIRQAPGSGARRTIRPTWDSHIAAIAATGSSENPKSDIARGLRETQRVGALSYDVKQ